MYHRLIISGPLVLMFRFNLFLYKNSKIVDRDQTVSRRSKPSSRTTLMVEQTNPWKIIHNQDVMSRHRGAKQSRRYEL